MLRAPVHIPLKPADVAWLSILAITVAVDATADEGDTLSERADQYRPRILVQVFIVATALHLMRVIPRRYRRYDPWSVAWHIDKRYRRRRPSSPH